MPTDNWADAHDRRVAALADVALREAASCADALDAAEGLRAAAARTATGTRDPSGTTLLWSVRWRLIGYVERDGSDVVGLVALAVSLLASLDAPEPQPGNGQLPVAASNGHRPDPDSNGHEAEPERRHAPVPLDAVPDAEDLATVATGSRPSRMFSAGSHAPLVRTARTGARPGR